MGIKYIWDTNIAIYFLQQQFPIAAENFIDSCLIESKPCFSAITEIELLCWKTASDYEINVIENFISECQVFELEKSVKIKTAQIRRVHKIKLPDAIIAATALVYDLILITRNTSDFKKIDGLKLVDPFNL
ncbi:MAG: type II toxin-antitoxin system VapC family toxin [Sphingobacteriales bacterium]|jgi:predicted nucleic acid-binding protein|nr:type II toxin-antitoxin system VapC family toxin [Sphingobacteriales bacterium]